MGRCRNCKYGGPTVLACDAGAQIVKDRVAENEATVVGRGQVMEGKELDACG